MSDEHRSQAERAVIDRLGRLSVVLPAMAEEAAKSSEKWLDGDPQNRRLRHRVAQLKSPGAQRIRVPPPRLGRG